MFLLGLLVVFGCLLGIFGKAVESALMLRIFSLLVLTLSLLFLSFSCASFAQVWHVPCDHPMRVRCLTVGTSCACMVHRCLSQR